MISDVVGSHTLPKIRCLSWKKKHEQMGWSHNDFVQPMLLSIASWCMLGASSAIDFSCLEPYVWSLNAPSVLGTRVTMFSRFKSFRSTLCFCIEHPCHGPIIIFLAGFFPRLAAWNTLRYPWSPTMMGHDGALHSLRPRTKIQSSQGYRGPAYSFIL